MTDPDHSLSNALGDIIAYGLWARKQGYRQSTVEASIRALKSIARNRNLLNPESAKEYLAKASCSESRKERLVIDLARFYGFKGLPFTPPRYRKVRKLPFIPSESEDDQLISGMGTKTACFLQVLKETGIRPGEAWQLKWTDIDFERGTLNILPEKNSNPRLLKVSNMVLGMLNMQPRKFDYVFRNPKINQIRSMDRFRANYGKRRKRLALKLQNPRIQKISFKTLRHFKATMEYHKTKDILHVMQLLGHKNIRNTLVYTHLVSWESEEFISKVAKSQKEITELIEAGFDFILQKDGLAYFRKRK